MKQQKLATQSVISSPPAGSAWQANGPAEIPDQSMREASWFSARFGLFRALMARISSAPVPRPTDLPKPNPAVPAADPALVQENLARVAQAAELLEIEWARGYQAGHSELDSAIGPVPRMPMLSIPSKADKVEYVYLMGWEAGMRSAAVALGV